MKCDKFAPLLSGASLPWVFSSSRTRSVLWWGGVVVKSVDPDLFKQNIWAKNIIQVCTVVDTEPKAVQLALRWFIKIIVYFGFSYLLLEDSIWLWALCLFDAQPMHVPVCTFMMLGSLSMTEELYQQSECVSPTMRLRSIEDQSSWLQGNGAGWCNGDCLWKNGKCESGALLTAHCLSC